MPSDIKIRKPTKVNVKKFLYALVDKKTEDNIVIKTAHHIYLGEVGNDADIFFVVADEEIGLGEQKLALEKINEAVMPVENEKHINQII
jgi:predicted regulator of Ras-like GTPase activity (Roadblock/LC7/MglB family)